MLHRYSHVAQHFRKIRLIVVSLAIFCALHIPGSNCYKVSVSVYHEENFAVKARPERDTVAVDPSYFHNDDDQFVAEKAVQEISSVDVGSAEEYTFLDESAPTNPHEDNLYRDNTPPVHSKAKTIRRKSKAVTGNIKHTSQGNKQETDLEIDPNNRLRNSKNNQKISKQSSGNFKSRSSITGQIIVNKQGHVTRQRRAAGWSVDDEKNRASKPDKRRRRRKKKRGKQEAMVKYVKANMFRVVVVPVLVLSVLLGGFIWYRCCMEGDVCCLCRACPCACCHPKEAAQAGMQGYVAGVRRDDKGGYFYDELTEEEIKAAEQMGEAALS